MNQTRSSGIVIGAAMLAVGCAGYQPVTKTGQAIQQRIQARVQAIKADPDRLARAQAALRAGKLLCATAAAGVCGPAKVAATMASALQKGAEARAKLAAADAAYADVFQGFEGATGTAEDEAVIETLAVDEVPSG